MKVDYKNSSHKDGIYKITNLINGKAYIGSAKNFSRRLQGHLNSLKKNKHHNKHLQASWNKYGPDTFIFEVVEVTFGTLRQRRLLEQKYINIQRKTGKFFTQKLKTIKKQGPWSLSPDETKRKIGESHKRRWKNEDLLKERSERSKKMWADPNYKAYMKKLWLDPKYKENMRLKKTGQTRSDETKQKLREQKLGEANPMFGKDFSAEHREKMGKSRRGKVLGPKSDETKKRISEARKGKGCVPCKEETKKKISLANKGKKPSQLAIQRTIETKTKIYNITLISPTGQEVFLEKITKEFLSTYGFQMVGLNKLINGRIKSHKGWKKSNK